MLTKNERRLKIKKRIRAKISGTAETPRIAVFRSNTSIYAQLIDDVAKHTIVSASTKSKELQSFKGNKVDAAKEVGKLLAKMATDKGVSNAIFDRSGYIYHGRVKALADGAREGGLKF